MPASVHLAPSPVVLQVFKTVTDKVYGPYTLGQPWRPKPYEEEKGRWVRGGAGAWTGMSSVYLCGCSEGRVVVGGREGPGRAAAVARPALAAHGMIWCEKWLLLRPGRAVKKIARYGGCEKGVRTNTCEERCE